MAIPTPPPILPVPQGPAISRRPSSEGVGRVSSDSNQSGGERTIPAPRESREKEQGSSLNLREHGGRGDGEAQAASNEGDRGLPIPATSNSNPFAADGNILQTIAARFNAAREFQKVGAWKQLQTDLMNASPYICPILIPYKDLIQIVSDIEKEIKGSNAQAGRSNEELLSEFLNGKGDIKIKDLDSHASIEVRDEESPAAVPSLG